MLQTQVDDTALPPFIAAMDAQAQHKKFWPGFDVAKQEAAMDLSILCQAAYFRSKVYMNAREKFIAIKVDRPKLADKLQNDGAFDALHKATLALGIEPVATKNNLLFRIAK
jgi:hypothetical protein